MVAMRTPQQIRAQLEARMVELEKEAASRSPTAGLPCDKCRWSEGFWSCANPLVVGFGRNQDRVDWLIKHGFERHPGNALKLCGPEKALWESGPTIWQRFIDWFLAPWKEA